MTLIASISGIRGTIGGNSGNNLTPIDIVNYTAAFGLWLTARRPSRKVVIGRDGRKSGPMLESIVSGTLMALGFEVIDLGLSTTPTVELAVPDFDAAGGIVLTASHNPAEWNALKLLNYRGEFLTQRDGEQVKEILENQFFSFAKIENIGSIRLVHDYVNTHIEKVLGLSLVDQYAIQKAGFKVVVDGINSSGGVYVPQMLEALGLTEIHKINCEPDGNFAHNPEPLEKNLQETCAFVKESGADLGIVVDPDVDRLVFIDENGKLFGEEYTLVAVADYVLQWNKGAVVSNLSSSRALRDLAEKHGCPYKASAVGEVNVIDKMKRSDAVIGGEGNGGVILPDLHYGRDALVGIALFLTHLAHSKVSVSELRSKYPDYFMSKQKAPITSKEKLEEILQAISEEYKAEEQNDIDGLKIDFADSWVHLRASNTEPIIRIYSEAGSPESAEQLADTFRKKIESFS